MEQKKVTVPDILRMKAAGERITMVTAYDCPFARLLDEAGVDILLVGDSLGMVVQGQDTTLPVTLDEMVYHTRMVARGRKRALVLGDLPFGSYQASPRRAVESAVRLVKEGGAEAVKLEGGRSVCAAVTRMVEAGIPVMGHLGLTPQSVHQLGGFRPQGRDSEAAERLLKDAEVLEKAGAFAIVLESIPDDLAGRATNILKIPTIGIGAGTQCDGQVLVSHDMLGLTDNPPPFAKPYARLSDQIVSAAHAYIEDVRGASPTRSASAIARSPNEGRSR